MFYLAVKVLITLSSMSPKSAPSVSISEAEGHLITINVKFQ